MLSRRSVLRLLAAAPASLSYAQGGPVRLPSRKPGELDIHHIDTGRGNSALLVGPDGMTLMVDAGASLAGFDTSAQPRPDGSRRPGEWIARYAMRHSGAKTLDTMLVTHIHPDHMGDVNDAMPLATGGGYRLTGVTDVDAMMPTGLHIDRAFPEFGETTPINAPFTTNYLAYLRAREQQKRAVEAAKVGSENQIRLSKDGSVKVRVLAANARVWSGQGETSASVIPQGRSLTGEEQPNENIYSVALKLTYGKFSYFTGGDLCNDTHDGRVPWLDVESPVAKVAGKTDVATANHHGYFDATGAEFVKVLDSQAFIIQAWDVGHPAAAQAQRMLGDWPGAKKHDVFATNSLPGNALINSRFVPKFRSRLGHVVVRVAADTQSFRIFVLDSSNERDEVLLETKPYRCGA